MKQQPQRMCIACRMRLDKQAMLRIVRSQDGEIRLDFTGKAPGRGAYLCDSKECLDKVIRQKTLNRVFKQEINPQIYAALAQQYDKRG